MNGNGGAMWYPAPAAAAAVAERVTAESSDDSTASDIKKVVSDVKNIASNTMAMANNQGRNSVESQQDIQLSTEFYYTGSIQNLIKGSDWLMSVVIFTDCL